MIVNVLVTVIFKYNGVHYGQVIKADSTQAGHPGLILGAGNKRKK